jgi:hypothetical protein
MSEWLICTWGGRRIGLHSHRHREVIEDLKADARLVRIGDEWKLRLPRREIFAVLLTGLTEQENEEKGLQQ